MFYLSSVLQIIVALGLLNVWLVRYNQKSPFRGGNAETLHDEFKIYGLPDWSFYLIGIFKVGAAVALLLGIWFPILIIPAAAVICVLMIGAILMHLKVGDPLYKSIPGTVILVISSLIGLLNTSN